jgi:ABC-type glycerol-3-phosphate transport system substrate-binding protein
MARTPLLRSIRQLARDARTSKNTGIPVDEVRAIRAERTLSRRGFLTGAAAGAAVLGMQSRIPSPAAADAVNLEFWTPADDPVGSKIITDLAEGFNSSVGQEKGIHVNTRIKPTTGDNYVEYTTAMTSSGSPDVVMTYVYNPVIAWAANGFIQPMDAYAKAAGVDPSDYFPIAWNMVKVNGHLWGLMQEFDFYMLGWNKAIHPGAPPKTIADLDALSQKYTVFDKKGHLVQAGHIPWIQGGYGQGAYYIWGAAFGASWYDRTAGKWTINTPANRAVMAWFAKYSHMLGGRLTSDAFAASVHGACGELWNQGKTAFRMVGEWETAPEGGDVVLCAPHMKHGYAWMPTTPGVPYGTNITAGGNLFLLPTRAAHPREAAIFMVYMGSYNSVKEWNIRDSNIPPLKSVAFSAEYSQKLPEIGPWLSTLRLGKMIPAVPSPLFPLFDTEMGSAIDEVTFFRKTPAQALAHVEAKVTTAVQQFKVAHPTWPNE